MKDASRPISLGLYLLVLLCFLLPFARVSCDKQEVVQANGYQVAFGKEIPAQSDSTGGKKTWESRPATPDYVAIACLIATLIGIGLVLVRGRDGAIIRAVFSEHGVLLMLALWGELSIRVTAQLTMLAGYWAALALFGAACVVNLVFIRRLRSQPTDSG